MELVKPVPLDTDNHLATIAMLRDIAAKLESGELPRIQLGCIVAYDTGGGLVTSNLGAPTDYFRLIGLLEAGKTRMMDILMEA